MRKSKVSRQSPVVFRSTYSMSSQITRLLLPRQIQQVRRWEMVSLRR